LAATGLSSSEDSSDDEERDFFRCFVSFVLLFFSFSTGLNNLAVFVVDVFNFSYSSLMLTTSILDDVTLPVPVSPICLYLNFSSGCVTLLCDPHLPYVCCFYIESFSLSAMLLGGL
jgi:hypothetical protein